MSFTYRHFLLSGLLQVLFLIFSSIQADGMIDNIVHLTPDYTSEQIAVLKEQLPCLVEEVTYDADVVFSSQEFYYLLGFTSGSHISIENITQALFYFFKKNKFKEITITCTPRAQGIALHFSFTSYWTVERVKIKGILFDKDRYRHLYLIEQGEEFNEKKHEHSIAKITESLIHEGYGAAKVTGVFSRDNKTKAVIVKIVIDRGARFKVGVPKVIVTADEAIESHEVSHLKEYISSYLTKELHKAYYDKSTLNKLADSIREYAASQGFLQINIKCSEQNNPESNHIDVTWDIEINNKRRLVFCGNHFFSHKQLLDVCLAYARSVWLLPASMIAQELVRVYKRAGFWSVNVETREEVGRYFFLINEGQRAQIGSIEIKNATFLDQKILSKRHFSTILKTGVADQQAIELGLDSLIYFYVNAGFLDAKIVTHEFKETEDPNIFILMITMDEGRRHYFGDITVEEFCELADQGPIAAVRRSKKLIPFTVNVLNEQRQWLQNQLYKKGFLAAQVHYEKKIDSDQRVAITWQIKGLDQEIHFGKTVIQGSHHLPFDKLMAQLQYQQDGLWDQDKIRQTFTRIKELNIFETISLVPSNNEYNAQSKTVIMKLHADDPYEVRLRAGGELQYVQNYRTISGITYKLGGTFMYKNPLGQADLVRLDVDLAQLHQEIVGRYQVPIIHPVPALLFGQVYRTLYNQPHFIGNDKEVYIVTQQGFLAGFEKKNEIVDFEMQCGFEWMNTKMNKDSVPSPAFAVELSRALDFEPFLLNKTIPYLFFEPTLFIDYVDNKLNPRFGSRSLFTLKAMFPLSYVHANAFFVRAQIDQALFIPFKQVVGAFRLRLGHIFHRTFSALMPTERFYLGGSQSLRSYETDSAPPLGLYIDEQGKEHCVPRGGKSMFNMNAEVRFPLPFFKDLGGVVFQDMGALSGDKLADFKAQNLLHATGFGLRYNTPIGPLRFDIGWKWKKHNACEGSYAWFLTFGHTF